MGHTIFYVGLIRIKTIDWDILFFVKVNNASINHSPYHRRHNSPASVKEGSPRQCEGCIFDYQSNDNDKNNYLKTRHSV